MSTRIIASTLSASDTYWALLRAGEQASIGHMRRMDPADILGPIDVYAALAALKVSYDPCTINLLPGDDPTRNTTQAASAGWEYNTALTAAESAAITAAQELD